MSQIGRVFSVLNVALAAIFLWSAGTFLQKYTSVKEELNNEISALQERLDNTEKQLVAKDRELGDSKRQLQASQASLQSSQTEVADLQSDNKRLEDRLSQMERDVKNINSSLGTVSSSIEAASQLAAASQRQALEASSARDEAIREKEVALADKRDAEVLVANLENKISNLEGSIAQMSVDLEQQANIIAFVRERFPTALVDGVAPKFSGRVTNVGPQGRLVTLQITEAANLAKPGYSVAVWDDTGYKGEVVLTDVYEEGNAVGRVHLRKQNAAPIRIGDSFSSQAGS
jgi:hypothetical protein